MLFIAIWRVDPSLEPKKVAEAAAKVMEKGWPPEGVEVQGFYMFPGHRGVTIMEAASEEAVWRSYIPWHKEIPGIFTEYDIYPAVSIEKVMASVLED